MRKTLLLSFLVLSFLTVSISAQSYRLQNLSNDLQRNSDDLADKAYREFTNRYSNSRSDIDNLLTAQQLKATADVFRRLVNDNRSNSELRDVANALSDLSRRSSYSSSLNYEFRQVQRNIDDISREVGGSGSSGGRDPERERPKDVIGRVRWRGTIDDEVNLVIRGGSIEVRTISGRSYTDGIFNFTSPLPERKVDVYVDKKKGRGSVKVIQSPTRENDFTTVIQVRDKDGGAREYDLDIYWTK